MNGPIVFGSPGVIASTGAPAPQGPSAYPALANATAAPAWAPPQPQQGIPATGVSIQIDIQIGYGATVRGHLHFGHEHVNPQAMAELAIALANMGLVKPYTPKPPQSYGDRGRGGYGGDRGGFGGRGGGGFDNNRSRGAW